MVYWNVRSPGGAVLGLYVGLLCIAVCAGDVFGGGAEPSRYEELSEDQKAWVEEQLTPLRSEEVAVFRKKCMEIAQVADWLATYPSVYHKRRDMYASACVERKTQELLHNRLRVKDGDPRFKRYALEAARMDPWEFREEAVDYLEKGTVELQCAAVRLLVHPRSPGEQIVPLEERDAILKRLVPKLEGDNGERLMAAAGNWANLLGGGSGRLRPRTLYDERLQNLGEKYLQSDNAQARDAAAGLLMILDLEANYERLLDAFRSEPNARVAALMWLEFRKELAGASRKRARAMFAEWKEAAANHQCVFESFDEPIILKGSSLAYILRTVCGSEIALRFLHWAQERVEKDPDAIERAKKYVERELYRLGELERERIRRSVRKINFTFSEKDAEFWLEHGLDKKLCEILLEASEEVQEAQEESESAPQPDDGGKEQ